MSVGLFQALVFAWGIAEFVLAIKTRAARSAGGQSRGGSFRVMWAVIALSMISALAAQLSTAPRLPAPTNVRLTAGSVVLLLGLVFRLWSILVLGRYFSVDVAIQESHEIVRRGPYRYLRHPSYTGLMIGFLGFGIALGNWLSLFLAVFPTTAVILYRISVEEQALLAEFGEEYERYRAATKRLVPGIY